MQLTTIAISALMGAFAKNLVDWILSNIKTTTIVINTTDKVKVVFSKNNRGILYLRLVLLLFIAYILRFLIIDDNPSRFEIVMLVFTCILSVLLYILISILAYINKKFV